MSMLLMINSAVMTGRENPHNVSSASALLDWPYTQNYRSQDRWVESLCYGTEHCCSFLMVPQSSLRRFIRRILPEDYLSQTLKAIVSDKAKHLGYFESFLPVSIFIAIKVTYSE